LMTVRLARAKARTFALWSWLLLVTGSPSTDRYRLLCPPHGWAQGKLIYRKNAKKKYTNKQFEHVR
jgi:hypothetical protein